MTFGSAAFRQANGVVTPEGGSGLAGAKGDGVIAVVSTSGAGSSASGAGDGGTASIAAGSCGAGVDSSASFVISVVSTG